MPHVLFRKPVVPQMFASKPVVPPSLLKLLAKLASVMIAMEAALTEFCRGVLAERID